MLKKRVFITGILVILITLFSTLLTASAVLAVSQTWYLWYDNILRMDDPTGGTDVTIVAGDSALWTSEPAAQGNVTFGTGNWVGDIGISGPSPHLQDILIELGYVLGSAFYSQGDTTDILPTGGFTIEDTGFTVPNGGYLAVKVYNNNDSDSIVLQTGSGGSWIETPDTAPDYPMPELATGILLASGIGGLGAYVWWRQRGKRLTTA